MMMKSTLIGAGVCVLAAALSSQAFAADDEQSTAAKQKAAHASKKDESASGSQARQSKTSNTRQTTSAEPVVVAVTTIALAEGTGCWAKIHDGENFSGRTLTLVGAQNLSNLEFGIGSDWEGDIDSVEVGPKAKLTLYDDENFEDDPRELPSNARISDLHQSLFDEGIESLRLACTDQSNANDAAQ